MLNRTRITVGILTATFLAIPGEVAVSAIPQRIRPMVLVR